MPEESFHKNVIDRVTAFGTAFLGLTVQCAQCHDHKYDPLSQKEFYSLYAFFDNLDAEPETVAFPKNGLQPPFLSLANSQQQERQKDFDQEIEKLDQQLKQLEQPAGEQPKSADESTAKKREELQRNKKRLQNQRTEFDRQVPYVMVMKERPEPRETHLLLRGQYDAPGPVVPRQTPAFLPALDSRGKTPDRLDLAEWLLSPEHPLTSRVAVNRLWQQLFGIGLVKTSEDFGAQGEVPTHPELLDYLAARFIEQDWKFKPLLREMVLSDTYRQSSDAETQEFEQDPDNRLLSRGSRYRMDAEVIRDQILQSSGLLVDTMFGPSVKRPQPPGLWKAVTMIGERFVPDQGDSIYRRSIYTYWKRGMPPPQMTILNAPGRDACIARRERTNTPTQALLLLNEPEYFRAAQTLAQLVLDRPADQRLFWLWETVTCRPPDSGEQQIVSELLVDLRKYYQAHPELLEEFHLRAADGEYALEEFAAWTVVVNTLWNMDVTRNRD